MAKAKVEPEKPKYDRKCVYTGRRLSREGKVWQRFELLPEKAEMYFSGVKRVHIGLVYKCSEKSISGKPERVFEDERIDNPEWDAADALVDARNAEKRAEAKIRAQTRPALKAAIIALRPLCRGLDLWQRRALVDYLLEEARKSK